MSANNETTLAVQDGDYLFLREVELDGDLTDCLGGMEFTPEKIKLPSGGGLTYEVPGEDGEPDSVKEFSGVILTNHAVNMFFDSKYTGGSNPPTCGSMDGKIGKGNPGGECKRCRLNQYGTGDNGSKACKNRQRVYILREGELLPMVLSLPTGSLKNFSRFIASQLSKGKKPYQYVTRFSLKKATNSGGIIYSQSQFKVDRYLTAEELPLIKTLSEQIKLYAQNVGYDNQADVPDDIIVDTETGEVIEPLGVQQNV
jgi:hypothetical protein